MALTDDDVQAEPEEPKIHVAICVFQGVLDEIYVCRTRTLAEAQLMQWLALSRLPADVTIDQWFEAKAINQSGGDLPEWWDPDLEDSTIWEVPLL